MSWFSGWFGRSAYEVEDVAEGLDGEAASAPENEPKQRRRMLPQFRGTAADKVRGGTRMDLVRLKLRTAFTPSRPVVDATMFAGRTELLQSLIQSIEDQQLHVVLFGSRGIGKTSTLHILCSVAREARYLVHYNSCSERTTFDELFRTVLRDLPLLYHENFDPTANEIEEGLSFLDLVGEGLLTVGTVSELLAKVSSTRVLVVLDEFDRAGDASFRLSIAELIKNLSDRASRVQLVIAGVAQNLNEIIEHIPSIRRNVLGMQLPNMSDEEISELIVNGETASGLTFTPDALNLVIRVVLGLPYLASLISQHAGLVALDRGRVDVEVSDVKAALDQALGEVKQRLGAHQRHAIDLAFDKASGRELGLLASIALENSGRLTPPLLQQRLLTTGTPQEYLNRLANEYQLIAPLADDPDRAYGFTDDGSAQYLWMRLMRDTVAAPSQPAGQGDQA